MPLLLILSGCAVPQQPKVHTVAPIQTYAPYYVDPAMNPMKPKKQGVVVPESYYSHKPGSQFAKPTQPPSGYDFPRQQQNSRGPADTMFGLGAALSGAAAGSSAYSSSPQGAVIMTPGQMPTYYYDNGDHGVIMQPGHMPTYVYPLY